ncbi:MAG: hypothetical protein NC038_00025 [Paludibacter sp.]|nr:hypothetical protein [Bacteroidales bacterium]MCM1068774.1 hypothetical protein [Prevotella sp.]MCM1354486.1 hypothetical protein [Bacteroides sp.]MCM1443289.1 hypothetical protein [Muribaculum sp.]MCM1481026.1 hypothetical protein [Paludibacter sp.]
MAENNKYELLTLRADVAGQAGHWQKSTNSPYGKNSIDESNSKSTTEPTSIPSPFARMELARTAFEIAASCKTWDEVPERYKKIVSDCLDVAEIFFNYSMYSKYIEIIKWDKSNIGKAPLKDSELGKAMKKFMDSDKDTYHFEDMNAIYLLNYIGDNRPNKTGLNIIGATSPITMFFSVDNDLKYVSTHIHFTNNDKPFDTSFNSLEKRDVSFIQYLATLPPKYDTTQGGTGTFAKHFKALHDYIQTACGRLSEGVLEKNNSANYNKIEVTPGSSDFVNILGFFIECQGSKTPQQSDFEIKSLLVSTGKLPLVLPIEVANAYQNCAYIDANDLWRNNHAPVRVDESLNDRILPGTNIKYPYLTVSDFFEDTIVKMPYKLNKISYFDGNAKNDYEESYLLPMTPTFFKYFTTEDLRSMISMEVSGTVVKIALQIPIRNYSKKAAVSYITYTKTYQTNKNEANNIGDTVVAKLGLGIFPLVKTNDINVADYRVALFDKVGIDGVRFYNKDTELESVPEKTRRKLEEVCGIKTYVIEKRHFDRIDIQIGDKHGYIVPLFKEQEGSKQFRFSVDFGTTNTHIAYSIVNEKESSPFDCATPQIARLHENYNADRDIIAGFEDNYLPTGLGATKMLFPIRSAFAEARPIDYGDITYTLSDGNIPFRYEKVGPVEYLDIQTGDNLKWSANRGRIGLYIRNIAFILHNKVLLEKGRLKDVQIRWFYPASMSTYVRTMMEQSWNKAYTDYFDANYAEGSAQLTSMSESIAPYCHYINKDEAMGIVTTIDIGGGTTDVYVSDGKKNEDGTDNEGMLLSFRFASNAIFGDGYNNNINNNGFVKKYRKEFEDVLKSDEALKNAMSKIAQKGNSSELISFFFSLGTLNKPGVDFIQKLVEDQKFKYVFLVFYSAILYHVAHAMKAKGIDLPQTVAFSGNGSKTLQVISQSSQVQQDFVKKIFEKVYGRTYPNNQRFYLKFDKDRPKEATANGGLEATTEQATAQPEQIVLLGTDNKTFVVNEKYDTINDEQKKAVINNVIDFINFIPTLNENNRFGSEYNLDVTILNKILEICKQNLSSYLDLGIDKVLQLLADDRARTTNITESLFFLPIVGMLNNLAKEIYVLDCNK